MTRAFSNVTKPPLIMVSSSGRSSWMRGFLLHDLDDDGQISGEPEHTVGMKPAETGHTADHRSPRESSFPEKQEYAAPVPVPLHEARRRRAELFRRVFEVEPA